MKFIKYLSSFLDTKTSSSTRSLSLFISSIVGGLLGLVLCFSICYDVIHNGYIKTDLADSGIFLLCVGGYMAGAGSTKAITEIGKYKYGIKKKENEESNI